jgi:putative endonuclease
MLVSATMWFVYILKCADNTFYTGCTSDLEERIRRHSKEENTYTKSRLPVILYTILLSSINTKLMILKNILNPAQVKLFLRKDSCELQLQKL